MSVLFRFLNKTRRAVQRDRIHNRLNFYEGVRLIVFAVAVPIHKKLSEVFVKHVLLHLSLQILGFDNKNDKFGHCS